MVMLHRMRSDYTKDQLAVVHCNFQLRGEESDADEKFLETSCQALGIRLHAKRMDTEIYATGHRVGIQEAARELRYQYFEDLMQEYGYACVATAHHRDDSIETYFINLLRGSGPEGLGGILEDNERKVIRPLLNLSRAEILDYAKHHGVAWREDSSNTSLKYLRNRVRHELVPLMTD
ncbi:UNVERIFIED_CONTAM: hypothetical protein GTU68_037774, partial [Idotea baltica]|nr:hypothetical protein [Idotea baltica]